MKKIALLNVYDIRNRGDLAIVLCQMEWLKQKYPQAQFILFSRFHATNSKQFGRNSVRSIFGTRPDAGRLTQLIEMVLDYWHATVCRSRDANERLRAFYDADMYGLTGGGYLYSSRFPLLSRNLINLCQTSILACRTGKPMIQFSQSFGPFSKGVDVHYVKKLCRELPRLSARSNISKQLLDGWGFGNKTEMVPDIVFLIRKLLPHYFSEPVKRQGLGIAPVDCSFAMSVTPKEREAYLEKLAQVGEFFHRSTGEAVFLFSQVQLEGSDDDSPAVWDLRAKLVQRKVPVSEIAREVSLPDYLGEFQKLRMFIGSRMHSCIFAFVANTPMAGLAYQPKFFGTFETMGRPEWVKPINDWTLPWATDWIDQVLKEEGPVRAALQARSNIVVTQIEQGLEKVWAASLANNSDTSARAVPTAPASLQPWQDALVAAGLVGGVATAHYFMGPHFVLIPCYAAPCAWLTWRVGLRWGNLIAIIAAFLGPAVQRHGQDADFALLRVQGWNTLMRLLLFITLVVLLAQLRQAKAGFKSWIKSPKSSPKLTNRYFAPGNAILTGLVLLSGTAFLHDISNKNLNFLPIYLISCLWLTLTVGRRWGTIAAISAAIIGPIIQAHGDPDYSSPMIQTWNSVMRFIILETLVLLISWRWWDGGQESVKSNQTSS